MNLNSLIGLGNKEGTRVGRGIGSGKGKTSGRGTKGQNSRSGGGVRVGFEGGQLPLTQRLPQLKGFKSIRPKCVVVNLSDLATFNKAKITKDDLLEKGYISSKTQKVKLLSRGEIKKPVELHIDCASEKAKKAIESAGGKLVTGK